MEKCTIVFIDNTEKVITSQRKYFNVVLANIKNIYPAQLQDNLNVDCSDKKLIITIDGYEFTMLHEIVNTTVTIDDSNLRDKVKVDNKDISSKVTKVFNAYNTNVKTLFVVDLCLETNGNQYKKTGVTFATKLKRKVANNEMQVAACSGVPLYDRIYEEKGFDVFHRSLEPDNTFSSLDPVFEQSRFCDRLRKMSEETTDKRNLLFLLDILINNPYQNTQYLGDILMKAFLFCEGIENT